MRGFRALLRWCALAVMLGALPLGSGGAAFAADRAEGVAQRVAPRLQRELDAAGLTWGAPVLLRIFKLESELEVWIERADGYQLFRRHPICRYSGALGPKQREGDLQAPEGFYRVTAAQMNPASRYHLSFDLGYPNPYDRAHARTGAHLMVHGNCVSIGCYAMGDAAIEEIYTLLAAAFAAGARDVPVHAFPFRFDRSDVDTRIAHATWGPFWLELRAGWDAFEQRRRAPSIRVVDGHYQVRDASR